MRVGLIDVDGHNFPNIALMKISAYHKAKGDHVEWYQPLFSGHMDVVYMSKVFSFSSDYPYYIDADHVYRGGTGYCIKSVDGREVYDKSQDNILADEIEHQYPDYSLYGIEDTAYGFLTRGCPRQCPFCHTGAKDGILSYKVADLNEFWNGQKNIVLLDQNILACRDRKDLLHQLADSKAYVEFNGGIDIRIATREKIEELKKIKINRVHFAWDRYKDKNVILPKLKMFSEITGWKRSKVLVYCLVNFESTLEQDLERIYSIRDIGFAPYVMIYGKDNLPKGHILRKLQRYVNSPQILFTTERFEDYENLTSEQREYVKGLNV